MSLKFPGSNIDFRVTPAYFLGDFDIYDREDSLGEYLNQFDPNDRDQLHVVLREKLFGGGRIAQLTTQHKAELMKVLIESLKDKNYDFQSLVSHDREPGDYFALPWDWEFDRPRFFFEEVYRLASKLWFLELKEAGMNLPNFSEVNLPEQ